MKTSNRVHQDSKSTEKALQSQSNMRSAMLDCVRKSTSMLNLATSVEQACFLLEFFADRFAEEWDFSNNRPATVSRGALRTSRDVIAQLSSNLEAAYSDWEQLLKRD